STAIFYWNKDAFRKAGLDPEKPPKTWKEFLVDVDKLQASGQKCAYTTSWPSWVHVENFAAWHNIPIGTKENGMASTDTQFAIIGGASLWVMGGKTNNAYKGVAKFFAFLSRPEIQMEWHTSTGYVPITYAAYEMTKKSGFYDKNPGAEVAIKMLTKKPPTANSKGLRFGNYVQGRQVIEEEMEAVFSGKKDAKAALDEAVKRGNEILRKFEAANRS